MSGKEGQKGSFGGLGNAASNADVACGPVPGSVSREGKRGSFGGLGSAASNVNVGSGPTSTSASIHQEGASQSRPDKVRSGHVPSFSQRGGRGGGRGGGKGGYEGSEEGHEGSSGSDLGRGCRSGQGGGRGERKTMDPTEALGRCMTAILRHQAANYQIEMKSDGYVLVSDLLKQRRKTAAGIPLTSHSEDDVRKAVTADSKQRFGLKEENGILYIRANQGHTITTVKSDHLLKPITSPSEIPVCVHGTYEKFLNRIWEEGLRRMTRNHVHFATGLPKEDGVISGMRATAQILIYLNVEKAMQDGMKFYISDNNVVLTEGFNGAVPAEYFKRVVKKLPDGKEIQLYAPPRQVSTPVGETGSIEE